MDEWLRDRSRYNWSLVAFLTSLFESGNGGIQPVGALGRQHPTWVLGRKRTNFVELFDFFLTQFEVDRREIVLKLIEALRSQDDGGHHWLGQQPRKGDSGRAAAMGLRDRSHDVENFPSAFLVYDRKIEIGSTRAFRFLVLPAKLAGEQAAGERTPNEQSNFFSFKERPKFAFEIATRN